jgi:hypothetical protein
LRVCKISRNYNHQVVFLMEKAFCRHIQYKAAYVHYIQGVSQIVDITAGGDFLGLCGQKSSYKHVSDFGRLRRYGHFLIPVHALV